MGYTYRKTSNNNVPPLIIPAPLKFQKKVSIIWVFEICLEIDKSLLLKGNILDFGILTNVQSLTVPWLIDQFGRKMCQKKHKDIEYQLI